MPLPLVPNFGAVLPLRPLSAGPLPAPASAVLPLTCSYRRSSLASSFRVAHAAGVVLHRLVHLGLHTRVGLERRHSIPRERRSLAELFSVSVIRHARILAVQLGPPPNHQVPGSPFDRLGIARALRGTHPHEIGLDRLDVARTRRLLPPALRAD